MEKRLLSSPIAYQKQENPVIDKSNLEDIIGMVIFSVLHNTDFLM